MLQITENSSNNFKTIAKWSRFLGILNMIMGAFLFLFSFSPLFMPFPQFGAMKWIIFFVYLIMGLVIIWLAYTLYTSGVNIKEGIKTQDQLAFDQGIENQKTLFVFTSYFTIAMLIIYAIVIIIALAASMSYSM